MNPRRLEAEATIAKSVIETLGNAGIDQDADQDFAVLLASETDLDEMLIKVVREARILIAEAEGIKGLVKVMELRASIKLQRAQKMRDATFAAMQEAGRRRIDAPDFVASVRKSAGKVVVTDPDKLPDVFVKIERTPKLKDIKDAIASGTSVEGASLSNGAEYLDVR